MCRIVFTHKLLKVIDMNSSRFSFSIILYTLLSDDDVIMDALINYHDAGSLQPGVLEENMKN